MNDTKDKLRTISLNGCLEYEGNDGVLIRSSQDGFWDGLFEIIGGTGVGVDNSDNRFVLRIDCFGQIEAYLDGVPYPCCIAEFRGCGPIEYIAFLDWLEKVGRKAAEIKRREGLV